MSARAHKAAKPRGKRAPLERDRLTGLPAGGGARSRLESELAENVSRGEPVSLAIADIDELRDVNRVLGPDRADAVLRAVAKRIATSLPRGASAIRLAGDAFLALLPGTDPDQALIEMQAVRAAVSRSPVVAGRGAARREAYPTVSIGVAGAPRDGATFRELLASAQSAVRHAKTLGRDRVASPPDEKMVLKASYYSKTQLERLKSLAGGLGVNESVLLREALEDLLLKHKGLLS